MQYAICDMQFEILSTWSTWKVDKIKDKLMRKEFGFLNAKCDMQFEKFLFLEHLDRPYPLSILRPHGRRGEEDGKVCLE